GWSDSSAGRAPGVTAPDSASAGVAAGGRFRNGRRLESGGRTPPRARRAGAVAAETGPPEAPPADPPARAARGGYGGGNGGGAAAVIGTGSEVDLAVQAAKALSAEGRAVRVVSMPCYEVFCRQDAAYRQNVLPLSLTRRLVVEAGVSAGWRALAGAGGDVLGV